MVCHCLFFKLMSEVGCKRPATVTESEFRYLDCTKIPRELYVSRIEQNGFSNRQWTSKQINKQTDSRWYILLHLKHTVCENTSVNNNFKCVYTFQDTLWLWLVMWQASKLNLSMPFTRYKSMMNHWNVLLHVAHFVWLYSAMVIQTSRNCFYCFYNWAVLFLQRPSDRRPLPLPSTLSQRQMRYGRAANWTLACWSAKKQNYISIKIPWWLSAATWIPNCATPTLFSYSTNIMCNSSCMTIHILIVIIYGTYANWAV